MVFVLFFEGFNFVPLVLKQIGSFGVEFRDGFIELGLKMIGAVSPLSDLLSKGLLYKLRLQSFCKEFLIMEKL